MEAGGGWKQTYVVTDQPVSRPLRKEAESKYDSHTSSVTSCLEEGEIAGRLIDFTFDGKGFSNLAVGEINEWISLQTICVILCQN